MEIIKRVKRVVFDGYCYDWAVPIDANKRDNLIGRRSDKDPLDPYGAWREIEKQTKRKAE